MTHPDVVLTVPEIRDYSRINEELTSRLDEGVTRIVLAGVEGQRLLASRLKGRWKALIEIEGNTGPELAAETDAAGLTIVAHGDVADGAGRFLKAGRVVIMGSACDGLGYAQHGGLLLVQGSAGHRTGLLQTGGTLIVLGEVGRLAGERQSGGTLLLQKGQIGPHQGHGRRGGRYMAFPLDPVQVASDRTHLNEIIRDCGEWLPAGCLPMDERG